MDFSIKLLDSSQLDQIANLHTIISAEVFSLNKTTSIKINDNNVKELLLDYLKRKDALCLGAFSTKNILVGYIIAEIENYPDDWLPAPRMVISYIGVLKEFRNQKISSNLINQALNWAKENQIKSVELRTLAQNIRTQNLFIKKGFKPLEVRMFKLI